MPKQRTTYDDFRLGINDNDDPRKLRPGELSGAVNTIADQDGLRTMGGEVADAGRNQTVTALQEGYGLHTFSMDRKKDKSKAHENYIALADADNESANPDSEVEVDIFDEDSGGSPAWNDAVFNLGAVTGTNQGQVIFDYVEGFLRACDVNLLNLATQSKRWGYIDRTHFKDSDGTALAFDAGANNYDDFFSKTVDLPAPTRGVYGNIASGEQETEGVTSNGENSTATVLECNVAGGITGAFEGMDDQLDNGDFLAIHNSDSKAVLIISRTDSNKLLTTDLNLDSADGDTWDGLVAYDIYPPTGAGFVIGLEPSLNGAGLWGAGTYEIATSFIYDGNQESLLLMNGGPGVVVTTSEDSINVKVKITAPYDPRIIGGRVYIREENSNDEWRLLADVSLELGIRTGLNSEYTAWSFYYGSPGILGVTGAPTGDQYADATARSFSKQNDTYASLNGFPSSEVSIDVGQVGDKYQTSCILNRMRWIANVTRTNQDGKQVHMEDSIFPSKPGRFDTFPLQDELLIVNKDGQAIRKILGFADRLIVLKDQTVYFVNVHSLRNAYLEPSVEFKGISHPNHACLTDFGGVWGNEDGLFLYTGEGTVNLLERRDDDGQLKRFLKQSTWSTFWQPSTNITFVPKSRMIIIQKGTNAQTGDIYLYDMVKGALWYGDTVFADSKARTNLAVDWDGDVIQAHTLGTFVKWQDASVAVANQQFDLFDDTFNSLGRIKKLYKCWVNYKTSETQAEPIKHVIDGGLISGASNYGSGNFADTGDGSSEAWSQLINDESGLDCESNRMRISLASSAIARINDITVEYRLLPNKAVT